MRSAGNEAAPTRAEIAEFVREVDSRAFELLRRWGLANGWALTSHREMIDATRPGDEWKDWTPGRQWYVVRKADRMIVRESCEEVLRALVDNGDGA